MDIASSVVLMSRVDVKIQKTTRFDLTADTTATSAYRYCITPTQIWQHLIVRSGSAPHPTARIIIL